MSTTDFSINQLQHETHLKRLLLCADKLNDALKGYCLEHNIELIHCRQLDDLEPVGRVDCALVVGWLEHHSEANGTLLLSRLRNLHSPHIWLLLRDCEHWHMNQLLGLGFQRAGMSQDSGETITAYQYQLESYNRKRSWNSAQHWANPENWGKYWW